MSIRLFMVAGMAMTLLSTPVSLARYKADAYAQRTDTDAAVTHTGYSADAAAHIMSLVAMLAKPEPILAPGAAVLTQDGITVGRIEDVVVHRSIIQAVMSLPRAAVATTQAAYGHDEFAMILVPATAFETQSGQAVLAIPLEQLNEMERYLP
ncbi:MAG: hypothetical protein AAF337_07460 [Pseudomonadota bacterium]